MRWLLALWLAIAPACAQEAIVGSGVYASKSSAAAYTGPGDIVASAKIWLGLRAYSAAIAAAGTQKVVNLRNTGTSETCDVLVATNGGLATTVSNCSGSSSGTALSTFCGTCTVTKLYDQSGNGNDVSQGTAATQPTFTQSCLGALPCITWATSDLNNTSVSSISQPTTWSVVLNNTGGSAGVIIGMFTSGNTPNESTHTSVANLDIYAGSHVTATMTDSAWHATQAVFNGASSVLNVDDTKTNVNPGAGAASTCLHLGENANGVCGSGGTFLAGKTTEYGFWLSAFSSGDQTSMCHNQFTYWGTGTSC